MDGVKIIADAIRKERAEKAKTSQPPAPTNVADITAQFSNTGKSVENKKDTEQNTGTKDTEQNTDNTEQKNESEGK